jgi:hypothetical protein
MQYVPEFNTLTEGGDEEVQKRYEGMVEKRNLRWMLVGFAGVVLGTFVGVRAVGVAYRSLFA